MRLVHIGNNALMFTLFVELRREIGSQLAGTLLMYTLFIELRHETGSQRAERRGLRLSAGHRSQRIVRQPLLKHTRQIAGNQS